MLAEALDCLAAATEELYRAAQEGDWGAAEQALGRRDAQLGAVGRCLEKARLSIPQMTQLEQILLRGTEAGRMLTARRETFRAEIGALEAERRQLDRWTPQGPATSPQVDFTG